MSEFVQKASLRVCYRPNRRKARVFSARDCGRIVAYSREDGASDAELIAHILNAFGQKELACALYRILDILNTTVFLGAVLGILKGILTLLKGLKLIIIGKKSRIVTSILEFIIPERYKNELAVLLLYIGSVELAFSSLIVFITGIANNVAIYLLAKGVCETFSDEYHGVEVRPLEMGDVKDVLELTFSELYDRIMK